MKRQKADFSLVTCFFISLLLIITVFIMLYSSNTRIKELSEITPNYYQMFLTIAFFSFLSLSLLIIQEIRNTTRNNLRIKNYFSSLQNAFDEIFEYHEETGLCYSLKQNAKAPGSCLNDSAETRLRDIIHPEDYTRLINSLEKISHKTDINSVNLVSRGIGKNKHYHWVNIHALKTKRISRRSVITYLFIRNIDLEKRQEKQYMKAEHRLQLSLRGLYDEVFEIDLVKDTYTFIKPDDKAQACVSPASSGKYSEYIEWFINNCSSSEDAEIISQKLSLPSLQLAYVSGQEQLYLEFRRKNTMCSARWSSLTLIRDTSSSSYAFMAFVQDIHDRKFEIEQLQKRAELDTLTSLYNKGTTEMLISSYINETEINLKHAFFIIDIDDFKNINDIHGHAVGDSTLSDFAAKLKKHFRSDDIIGRIGGDEFVIFMKDIRNISIIKNKARGICALFNNTFVDKDSSFSITGSVGIALFPDDGSTYETIYRNADAALYRAKRLGKNQYRFFSETLMRDNKKNK